jgi:hypothetical protein
LESKDLGNSKSDYEAITTTITTMSTNTSKTSNNSSKAMSSNSSKAYSSMEDERSRPTAYSSMENAIS